MEHKPAMSREGLRHIEWRLENPADEWSDVAIYIDGVSLIDLVAQYEEACGFIPAGGYAWCQAGRTLHRSRHFLGDPNWPQTNGKVSLLLCACQCEGCWDFEARILVTPEYVEWSEFEQIHRQPGSPGGHWDYSDFGPFRFDRRQYETALAAAQPAT
jgi:hypothetical protein